MRKEERPLLGGSKPSYGATPQHTARRCAWPQRRYIVTFLGLCAALTRLGPRTNGPPTLRLVEAEQLEARVRPGEPRKVRRRDRGSKLARQRSAFTCGLSVVAAALILAPRLACGPDGRSSMVQGAGPGEARVARETRAGFLWLVAYLLIGVPHDLVDRELLRGGFPYPLTLTLCQLVVITCLGFVLVYNKASEPWRWNDVLLGLAIGLSTAVAAEVLREGGPRVAAAGAAVQGVCVLMIGYAVKESSENEEYDSCWCGRKTSAYPPGGHGAALALLVCFGGGGIAALGDARVSHNALCTGVLAASRLIGAAYLVAFERRFRSQEESVGAALYRTTPYACVLVAVAAILLELAPTHLQVPHIRHVSNGAFPRYDGGAYLIAPSCFLASLDAFLTLCVVKRFSALIVAVFASIRGALTALAGAIAYGDVITSLEYKGLMVLVLGLAVWSLEVARAALDPSSYPGAVLAAAEDPDDDQETGFIRETTLRPSEFLDEDAVSSEEEDDVLYVAPGVGDNIR